MRSGCFVDVVRSNDRDDSSDDLSSEERAYYENLEPDNAILMGKVEIFDDGFDHRYRSNEKIESLKSPQPGFAACHNPRRIE